MITDSHSKLALRVADRVQIWRPHHAIRQEIVMANVVKYEVLVSASLSFTTFYLSHHVFWN